MDMLYLSRPLVHTWQVDTRDELDGRRRIGVGIATVYVDAVYSIFMGALFLVSASSLRAQIQMRRYEREGAQV